MSFPPKLRKKFDDIIQNSKLSIFLSNESFENVENKIYFISLANRLKKSLDYFVSKVKINQNC